MLSNFSRGLWSGLAATGPMTLLMFSLFRKLPAREKSPLPPATITTDVIEKKLNVPLSEDRRKDLVLALHFGYGVLTSMAYAALARRFKFKSPVLQGAGYGLTIWGASYIGLAPLFGLRATAMNMTAKRNGLMIAAHVVWGACLAIIENDLRKNDSRLLNGWKKARASE